MRGEGLSWGTRAPGHVASGQAEKWAVPEGRPGASPELDESSRGRRLEWGAAGREARAV